MGIRVTCDQCHLNYCLKHRHPLDHDCKTGDKPGDKPVSRSGHAAFMRAQGASSSKASGSSSATQGNPAPVSNGVPANHRSSNNGQGQWMPTPVVAQNVIPPSASFQAGLTEE